MFQTKEPMDVLCKAKCLIIHDMVEIEAEILIVMMKLAIKIKNNEREAATNLFSTLPKRAAIEFMAL